MIIGLVLIAALGALGYAAFNFYMVKKLKEGTPRMQEIAKAMAANTTITLVRDNFRRFISTYYSKYLYRHTAPYEPFVQ